MKIFEELGTSQGLQPFALSKIAIALSIRFGSLSDEDFSADTEGLELNRQTKLLKNESRYGMHFYKNLLELDCNL